MFRATGFWSLAGLVVVGWIVADGLYNYKGTKVVGDSIVSLARNTGRQVSGRG